VYDVSVVLPTNMPSPAAASLRPLSPIIAVESAAERSGEFFVHYPHRDSYYCALYDDFPDDNCLNTVSFFSVTAIQYKKLYLSISFVCELV